MQINHARRLKTLVDHSPWSNGAQWPTLTPYEYICKITTSEPDRFIADPIHHMPGLNGWGHPWFLWIAYTAPLSPFHLPPEGQQSFGRLPADAASVAANRLPDYQAMLEALDSEIGRLLASIPAETHDSTYVIFLGGNAPPNQVTRDLYADHGAKGTIYDSGTRDPLIITGLGIYPGRSAEFVNTTDLHATMAALARAEVSTPDSMDFSPVLTGGSGARGLAHSTQFTERQTRGGDIHVWTIRQGDLKLAAPNGQPPQMQNVVEEPFELNELLATGQAAMFREKADHLVLRRDALLATADTRTPDSGDTNEEFLQCDPVRECHPHSALACGRSVRSSIPVSSRTSAAGARDCVSGIGLELPLYAGYHAVSARPYSWPLGSLESVTPTWP